MLLPRGLFVFGLFFFGSARAATVSYSFNITWVWAAPDDYGRPVIGINNVWPCPLIQANVNDTLEISVTNLLGNETTGIHWHGINQINTGQMDGPAGVTQCGIPPNMTVVYRFTADKPGTYWYHSHNLGQYPDGLRGPMVVIDPNDPNQDSYDNEVVLSVSDWYHVETLYLVREMLQQNNTQFRPPLPDNLLVNDSIEKPNIIFNKGKRLRIRLISYAALGSAMISFGSIPMKVIMIDASMVEAQSVTQLHLAAAQRYDFILESTDDSQNFPFLICLDLNRDFRNPNLGPLQWNNNMTGYLIANASAPTTEVLEVEQWQPADDAAFTDYSGTAPYKTSSSASTTDYDKKIQLDFSFCVDSNGYPRACFNNHTYIDPTVPSLYTAATIGANNTELEAYGDVNPFIVDQADVVQIVVNNGDNAAHPFHLHGHQFQVLERAAPEAGKAPADDSSSSAYSAAPPGRDTLMVNGQSYAVLRFVARNPGVYLFHCHIEWHVEMGLTATIISGPGQLQNLTFQDDMIEACQAQNIPVAGNAVGNADPTNLSGLATVPATSYSGSLYTAAPVSNARRLWAGDPVRRGVEDFDDSDEDDT
ncbi:putative iron transport multicopper oxidase FET3 [Podospora conica]|nr:putative iron transport multicopper oxidase FET3 [Schizothecium conicum]